MKNWMIFLLIFLILISIIFIALGINNPKDNRNSEVNARENQNNEITGNIAKEDSESGGISGNSVSDIGSGSSGSEGSSGSSSEAGDNTRGRELPSDLYTKPCGSYFLEDGIKYCAGVCPEGQCLVDDKSCYCRIV